jgi:hypothetical protein
VPSLRIFNILSSCSDCERVKWYHHRFASKSRKNGQKTMGSQAVEPRDAGPNDKHSRVGFTKRLFVSSSRELINMTRSTVVALDQKGGCSLKLKLSTRVLRYSETIEVKAVVEINGSYDC